MTGFLAVLVTLTAACSGGAEGSGAGTGAAETLGLYSSGVREGPVSRLGLPATELKDALLVSPHQTIKFARWAVARELTGEQLTAAGLDLKGGDGLPASAGEVRAPEGHELFIVDADDPKMLAPSQNGVMQKVSFTLVVGGQSRPLGNRLVAYNTRDALLAVVPVGAEVRLDLTDEGRTQSLDLRTGKRINAAAGLYPVREARTNLQEVWRYRGSTYTTVSVSLKAEFTSWTEKKGWASAGRAWLTGTVSVTAGAVKVPDMAKAVQVPVPVEVDLGKALRLSGQGVPARLFPAGTSALAVDLGFQPGTPEEAYSQAFAVEVPEKLSTFGAAFAVDLTKSGYVRDAGLSDASRTVTIER
ncbi:hypothetical protein [Paractinoplanes deccanensis]|nr:hypothetical protein [Actinoplanes deccanensis]